MNVKILVTAAAVLAFAPALASAAPGGNAPTNSGPNHMNGPATTGQPSQDCGALIDMGEGSTPGNSVNSPGSAFNPVGVSGTKYAGQQTQNSRNTASVSQYDVACLHGTR